MAASIPLLASSGNSVPHYGTSKSLITASRRAFGQSSSPLSPSSSSDVVSTSTAATQTLLGKVARKAVQPDYQLRAAGQELTYARLAETASQENLSSRLMTANGSFPSTPSTSNNNKKRSRQSSGENAVSPGRRSPLLQAASLPRNGSRGPSSPSSHHHKVSRATSVSPPESTVMNLRNRPLKIAATAEADDKSGSTGGSSAPAQTSTVTASARPGRPAGRRGRRGSSAAALANTTSSSQSSPSAAERHDSLSTSASAHPASRFFPLTTIGSVCELFRWQMANDTNDTNSTQGAPDLALLSIVLGIVEANLTSPETMVMAADEEENKFLLSSTVTSTGSTEPVDCPGNSRLYGGNSPAEGTPAPNMVPETNGSSSASLVASNRISPQPLDLPMPAVHWATVEELLAKFTSQIKESVDLSKYEVVLETGSSKKKTSRELIKKISDVVWSNLHRSYYKDRAHLQTLYSYLSGSRLDAYGVAYTVVAACQLLGLEDVRLVMSEDHAWVLFGDGETCEVTWHGKGNEDKLGEPVPSGEMDNSWLYLNGQVLVCDQFEAVATAVSAMNPSINSSQDSEELALLQQQLLWILYDGGHLRRYPMALGNLGDLEDICRPSLCGGSSLSPYYRREPMSLFGEAISSARKYYDDAHVYPYTYMGGYCFRLGRFKDALHYWSLAAGVVRRYAYSKEDEEIYNEFKEIANDLVPNIVKLVSTSHFEPSNWQSSSSNQTNTFPRIPLLQDPECFAALIRFYDGLCCWEEGASTPVLHIGWTKPLVATINKFDHPTRRQVAMKVDFSGGGGGGTNGEVESDYDDDLLEGGDDLEGEDGKSHHLTTIGERRRRRAASENSNHLLEEGGEGHAKNASSANGHRTTVNNNNNKYRNIKSEMTDGEDVSMISSEDENISLGGATGKKVVVVLSSKKFAGLRSLLLSEKLNTSAIQLQLTAQSQVNVNKRSRSGTIHKGSHHQASLGPELDFVSTTTTTLARTNTINSSNSNNSNNSTANGSNGSLSGNSHKRLRRD